MSDTLSREQIEACKESFLDEQKVFPPGSLGYQMLADNITICDMALLSAAPVAWAYIHAGECEEIGWGLPPEAVEDEATLLYAAPQQKLAASEPVAWHDLDQMTVYTPVEPTIPGTWTPLYAAPPRTFDEGLEAAVKVCDELEDYLWNYGSPGARTAVQDVSARIRALKEKP